MGVGSLRAHLPIDRLLAVTSGGELPSRCSGATLFADIAGFTALTAAFARQLGPRRGAEELTRELNGVFDVVIEAVHRYGGTVVDFSGDAVMCWFDDINPPGSAAGVRRAVTCAEALQGLMADLGEIQLTDGEAVPLSLKVAVAAGPALRAAVGDPEVRLVDILAGSTLTSTAMAEQLAERGEVVLDQGAMERLGETVRLVEARTGPNGTPVGVLDAVLGPALPTPWPVPSPTSSLELIGPWIAHLQGGSAEQRTELRTSVALFARFAGLDFDHDPDVAEALDTYLRWVQSVVRGHGGTLLQVTIGDKGSYLYIAFGAPVAHEDISDRAIACALDLRHPPESAAAIGAPAMGLDQGVARTGSYGGRQRRTYGVLGDAVNIAARLMTKAQPGEILATSRVRRSWRQRLPVEELGSIRLKGQEAPVSVVRVLDPLKGGGPRLLFDALVGREAELDCLVARIGHAVTGPAGRVVVLGEAGIGKSHLLAAARTTLEAEGGLRWLLVRCDETRPALLAPFVALLRDLFFQELAADLATGRQLLELGVSSLVEALGDRPAPVAPAVAARLEAEASYLGALLGLRWDGSPYERHDPATRRARCLKAVDTLVRAEALRRPVVVHIADAQWLDEDSRRLMGLLLQAATEVPLCVVVDSRPDSGTDPALEPAEDDLRIELGPLGPAELHDLAEQVLAGPAHPTLVEHLRERSGGNPLFAQQLLIDLRDRDLLVRDSPREDGQTIGFRLGAVAAEDLPASLSAVLVSRLDRLDESVQRAVQAAAVLGDPFEPEVLAALLELGPEAVTALIEDGEATGIWRRGDTGDVSFSHVLLRNAAYAMQLDEQLRRFHRRAAVVLGPRQGQQIDVAGSTALAAHEEKAGRLVRASARYRMAAEAANRAQAARDVVNALEHALFLGERWGASARCRARLHARLGEAAIDVGDYPHGVDILRLALSEDPQLSPKRAVQLLTRLGEALERCGRDDDAEEAFESALASLQAAPDPGAASRIFAGLAMVHGRRGELDEGIELAEVALSFGGDDPARVARAEQCLAVLSLRRGAYPAAAAHGSRSLAQWIMVDDRQGIAAAHNALGLVNEASSEHPEAIACFRESVAGFEAIGNEHGLACALDNLANALVHAGERDEGMACLERAVEILARIGVGSDGIVTAMWRTGSW